MPFVTVTSVFVYLGNIDKDTTFMSNLHCRLTFDLDNKNKIPGKNLLKL